MESVRRAVVIDTLLLLLVRVTGKRSLAQMTTFDLILLLMMSEAVQNDSEVLAAARMPHGLERMDQIKYAVLERSGEISIIPRERPGAARERAA